MQFQEWIKNTETLCRELFIWIAVYGQKIHLRYLLTFCNFYELQTKDISFLIKFEKCIHCSKIKRQITIFVSAIFGYDCAASSWENLEVFFLLLICREKLNKSDFSLFKEPHPLKSNGNIFCKISLLLIHRKCSIAECQPSSSYRACNSQHFLAFTVNITVFPRNQTGLKNHKTVEIQYALKKKRRLKCHTQFIVNANYKCRIWRTLKIVLEVVWSKMVTPHQTVLGIR